MLLSSKIKTWFGVRVEVVSETTTLLPSRETATTLPVTVLNVLTVGGFAVGSSTIRPLLLPINALLPCGLKTRELGGFGSDVLDPRMLLEVLMGTIELPQLKFVPHPVLVAHTVVLGVVPVTVALTILVG